MERRKNRRSQGSRWLSCVAAACAACGGGGKDAAQADLPREHTVIVPTTEVGYDVGVERDAGAVDAGSGQGDPGILHEAASRPDDVGKGDLAREDTTARDDSWPDPGMDSSCVPDCTGRVCGSNGCGGSCGTCKPNEVCQGGVCLCVPDCAGRECGPDGCGGTCKPGCPAGVSCLDTGTCAKSGPCKEYMTLQCTGEVSSSSYNTGWSPFADTLDQYSCDSTLAHGPEKVYRFIPDQSGTIVVTLSGSVLPDPPAFLNVYLLANGGEGCTSRSCVAWDHREVSAEVEAGRTYWVVVDAVQNNTASYYLSLSCSWAPASGDP